MDCPVCQVHLIVVERKQIELDFCIQCRGTWFDHEEFSLLVNQSQDEPSSPNIQDNIGKILDNQPDVHASEPHYPCPRCKHTMTKIDVTGHGEFYLDRCPSRHGLWFEENETEKTLTSLIKRQFSGEKALVAISNFVEEAID